MTPEEVWSGKKVNVENFKLFGNPVMVHVPEQKRRKWDKKSRKMIFIGYDEAVKGYRCIDPVSKEIKISRDVFFLRENDIDEYGNLDRTDEVRVYDEVVSNEVGKDGINELVDDSHNVSTINVNELVDNSHNVSAINENHTDDESIQSDYEDADDSTFVPDGDVAAGEIELRRSSRLPVQRDFNDYVTYPAFVSQGVKEPTTVDEALRCDQGQHWRSAMKNEMDSLVRNETYELVDLPPRRKPIKSKWVFKLKCNEEGNIMRYKARLVAKRCSQIYGIDYEEVYSHHMV